MAKAPELKLREGDKAPDFSALSDKGERISLKDLKGRNVVLYGSDTEFLGKELVSRLSGASPGDSGSSQDPRAQFLRTFGDLLKKHGYEHRGEIVQEGPTTFILKDQDMELPLVQELARRGREMGIRIKLM